MKALALLFTLVSLILSQTLASQSPPAIIVYSRGPLPHEAIAEIEADADFKVFTIPDHKLLDQRWRDSLFNKAGVLTVIRDSNNHFDAAKESWLLWKVLNEETETLRKEFSQLTDTQCERINKALKKDLQLE